MPERRSGRRPAGYWYRDPKAPEPEAGFTRLAAWRDARYPGASRTTLELLEYWRREFTRGESGEITRKVIEERGNELLVVEKLAEAEWR